jgi:hypothetical protein
MYVYSHSHHTILFYKSKQEAMRANVTMADLQGTLWEAEKKIFLMKKTILWMMHQERARGTISQIRGPETKGSSDLNGESTTIKGNVAQQEVGNNIQTGEHSSVCLFPFLIQFIMIVL